MKYLSVSILTDLHLDSHFHAYSISKEQVAKVFDPIFTSKADVLVVAGDLGHYNDEIVTIFGYLRELYFNHIVYVLGNHDYYLVNRIIMDDFDENSFNRIRDLRRRLNLIEGVYGLDGEVVEIEGVRFGGCDSWYDGSYWLKNLNPHCIYAMHHVHEMWKYTMSDAFAIMGIKQFDQIWEMEKSKIEAVYQKCDVMITHVMPVIDPKYIEAIYRKDKATAYFCFDGEKYLKETTAHTWIYGHSHTNQDVEVCGIRMINNALGYKGEAKYGTTTEKVIKVWQKPRQ